MAIPAVLGPSEVVAIHLPRTLLTQIGTWRLSALGSSCRMPARIDIGYNTGNGIRLRCLVVAEKAVVPFASDHKFDVVLPMSMLLSFS